MTECPMQTSAEYKVTMARTFHKIAARAFEENGAKWVETTLLNLLIAVDYLIEAEEAKYE